MLQWRERTQSLLWGACRQKNSHVLWRAKWICNHACLGLMSADAVLASHPFSLMQVTVVFYEWCLALDMWHACVARSLWHSASRSLHLLVHTLPPHTHTHAPNMTTIFFNWIILHQRHSIWVGPRRFSRRFWQSCEMGQSGWNMAGKCDCVE